MSDHANPELGTTERVFGKGVRVNRRSIDINDFDAMRAAAHRLKKGTRREIMELSEIEQRAFLKLAAIGADVIWQASELVALKDNGADRADITREQEKLEDLVRPLMGEPS